MGLVRPKAELNQNSHVRVFGEVYGAMPGRNCHVAVSKPGNVGYAAAGWTKQWMALPVELATPGGRRRAARHGRAPRQRQDCL